MPRLGRGSRGQGRWAAPSVPTAQYLAAGSSRLMSGYPPPPQALRWHVMVLGFPPLRIVLSSPHCPHPPCCLPRPPAILLIPPLSSSSPRCPPRPSAVLLVPLLSSSSPTICRCQDRVRWCWASKAFAQNFQLGLWFGIFQKSWGGQGKRMQPLHLFCGFCVSLENSVLCSRCTPPPALLEIAPTPHVQYLPHNCLNYFAN